MRFLAFGLIVAGLSLLGLGGAIAAEDARVVVGPEPWQLGFQPAMSPIMERVNDLHNLLLWIITGITLFVLGLMGYACWRFRASRNPVPSKRTHHALLEVTWTLVPVLILVVIAVPSFRLLYFQEQVPEEVDMTIKTIGRQWFWTYEYPDHGNFMFDAIMVPDEDLEPGQPRLLVTDPRVVLPIHTNIRVLVTASDVIHSWSIPALGIKTDGIPGRLNEFWIRFNAPGTYYGQCYELCGVGHPWMPITVEAVTQEEFAAWVEEAQQIYARVDDGFDVARTSEPEQAADEPEQVAER